ncbi:MAG: cysteine--tRNA ligase [Patescibacteria group bacterium]
MIKIYNTLSKKIEPLKTIKEKEIKLYSCGPTVYNYVHIGNLRAYIFVDLLKRFLYYSNFNVTHVMNITDVDDKTIMGSIKNNEPLNDYTNFYLTAFLRDLKLLNIQLPDLMPKATEHINDMVALIKELKNKGCTYEINGSVYFKISSTKNYGVLAQLDQQNLKENASGRLDNDEYAKENASDFVLWKAWTPNDGNVYWDTEIGRGRPGWHIECSAMSMKYLGETIDIHTGGVDLIFPHHTNEIAQSEKATSKKFVNYWMHNGHLLVDGKKMSKSLNNFYTLEDITKKGFDPLLLRLVLIKTHYRQILNFTLTDFEEAKKILLKFINLLINLDFTIRNSKKEYANTDNVDNLIDECRKKFKDALSDDLNISMAISHMLYFIKEVNKSMDLFSATKIKEIKEFIFEIDDVLGFVRKFYNAYMDRLNKKTNNLNIYSLLEKREQARALKDYGEADRLREKIINCGLLIEDTKNSYILKIE